MKYAKYLVLVHCFIIQLFRNPGGNSITGAIRESYGLAHQVLRIAIIGNRIRYQILQAGMNSALPKTSSKRMVVGEVSKKVATYPIVTLAGCAELV